jgi:hypothetical protein
MMALVTDALAALSTVLDDLADALTHADADRVLALEARLVEAVAQVRHAACVPNTVSASELAHRISGVRDALGRCRRLGGTVPAVLSVMFPGQVTYGRAGARMDAVPVRPALTQVS